MSINAVELQTLYKGVKITDLKDDVSNSIWNLAVTGQYHIFRKFILLDILEILISFL